MWSDADKLLLKVTPRTFSVVSQLTSGSSGGDWTPWRRRLSWKTTSLVLSLFNCKLFLAAHAAMLSSSAARPRVGTLSRDDEVRVIYNIKLGKDFHTVSKKRARKGICLKLFKRRCRLNIIKFIFGNRTVDKWNKIFQITVFSCNKSHARLHWDWKPSSTVRYREL